MESWGLGRSGSRGRVGGEENKEEPGDRGRKKENDNEQGCEQKTGREKRRVRKWKRTEKERKARVREGR